MKRLWVIFFLLSSCFLFGQELNQEQANIYNYQWLIILVIAIILIFIIRRAFWGLTKWILNLVLIPPLFVLYMLPMLFFMALFIGIFFLLNIDHLLDDLIVRLIFGFISFYLQYILWRYIGKNPLDAILWINNEPTSGSDEYKEGKIV